MVDVKEAIKECTKYNDGEALSSYKLTVDKLDNQLEPEYFWILDFLEDSRMQVEKLVDNFAASPGSGQFQDMAQKKGINQQQVTKISGDINQIVKSIITLIYDLKEFEIRLEDYDRVSKLDKKSKKWEAAALSLKQIWLDSVDIKKGQGAIHVLSAQGGYTTLRQLFMTVNSLEDVDRMEKEGTVNFQVKQILLQRVAEYHKWLEFSEKELTNRFKIERSYLRSQVETLKLYTSWIGPYMKAARELEVQGFEKSAALVSSFSTSLFELCLIAKKKTNNLPDGVENYNLKRDYYSCVVVNFKFRGHFGQKDQKGNTAFGYGGKLDMSFDSYSLHSEELELFEKEIQKQSFADGVGFFEAETEATLETLKEDLDHFLNYKDNKDEKKEEKKSQDIDPFSALFKGLGDLFKKKDKKDEKKEISSVNDITKENFVEKGVRSNAADSAKGTVYALYDVYKKTHRLSSSPEKFDNDYKEFEKEFQKSK